MYRVIRKWKCYDECYISVLKKCKFLWREYWGEIDSVNISATNRDFVYREINRIRKFYNIKQIRTSR
jgi:hypothetical protein